jgi:hypothetical protein
MRDFTGRPNVVVFEHDHARKIEAMRIDPTDEHAVLLNKSKA